MNPRRWLHLFAGAGFLPCLLAYFRIADERTRYSILISALVSFVGFTATKGIVPVIRQRTLRAGLHGKDINKKGSAAGDKDIPESLGLAPGVVFLVCVSRWSAPASSLLSAVPSGHPPVRCLLQICIVLFQQLHYYDAASVVHWLRNGDKPGSVVGADPQTATDAW